MTVEAIRYCVTGCKTKTDSGERIRVRTDSKSYLCRRCEDNLHTWLTKIPALYALLPKFAIPGSTEKNPETVATKRAEAPAPVRLEILDLLDTRHGRKWNGTAAAHDRRGVLGTLLVHAERLTDEKPLSTQPKPNVAAVCELLDRHRLWLAEQDWIQFLYADTQDMHRACADANGEYRRPPVGRCPIDTDNGHCEGPLFANPAGGVHCAKCDATWDATRLRQLGLVFAEQNTA